MSKKGLFFPLMVVLLLLVGNVFAQEGAKPTFCGNLSEADCQLLTEAGQAQLGLTSATFDLDGGLTISNLSAFPGVPFDSLSFTLTGSGSYMVDPTLMSSLSDFALNMTNLGDLMKDPAQIGGFYENLLTGLNGELNLSLALPEEFKAFGTPDNPVPGQLSVGLRLIDGVGYINLDALSEQLPQAKIPAGWYGFELAKFTGLVFQDLMGQMDTSAMPQMDFSMLSQFTDPAFLGEFVQMERLADENGEAVFATTIDYSALFASDTFKDFMKSQMSAYGGEGMSEAELSQVMDMVQQMYSGLELSVTTTIGLEDHYSHSINVALNWDMSALMAVMNSMNGSTDGASAAPAAPVVAFTLGLKYADFNAAPELEVPEAAAVLKAEDAIQMMGIKPVRSA